MAIFSRLSALAGAALLAVTSTRAANVSTVLAPVGVPQDHIQFRIRNGELGSRAVNLGSWLCTEHWMSFTSPLFKGVPDDVASGGEYAIMKHLGKEQGDKQFEEHWNYFITEEDFAQIAKNGFNTVRVTTGFWIINDEDKTDQSNITLTYPSGGLKHLDKVVNDWAAKYNLAVMVSLHAHRGSQNGFEHSAPVQMGNTSWSDDPANVKSSFNYATFIAHRYKDSPAFLGLNLMNEPNMPTNEETLLQYYKDVYKTIRADGNDCIIVTSPLLTKQGPPHMEDFMRCPDFYNVWHEWHIYYRWGWEWNDKPAILEFAANYSKRQYENWTGNPIFLGEWSLTTHDGFNLTDAELKSYAVSQMREAEKAPAGWAFWAWRHDEESVTEKRKDAQGYGWSLRQLLKDKVVVMPTDEPTRTRGAKCPKKEGDVGTDVKEVPKPGSGAPKGSLAGVAAVGLATVGWLSL